MRRGQPLQLLDSQFVQSLSQGIKTCPTVRIVVLSYYAYTYTALLETGGNFAITEYVYMFY